MYEVYVVAEGPRPIKKVKDGKAVLTKDPSRARGEYIAKGYKEFAVDVE